MGDEERRAAAGPDRRPGVTVYGCEEDEADLVHELAPRIGVVPTTTRVGVSQSSVVPVPRNRCISVSHRSELSARELRALQAVGVEYVSTRSIGLDHIDLDAAAAFGITVENVQYAPDGVADFTVMSILMATRHVAGLLGPVARHEEGPHAVRGRDLRDLTVGVVGVGRIGRAVISRLSGFGCRVLACSNGPTDAPGVQFVALDDLLRDSDVVTLHVPLDATTHHLIGREQIESMRRGAVLVNTARGALVDTEALIDALAHGRLGGAALDVVEGDEPAHAVDADRAPGVADHGFLPRLQLLPHTILTPHVAYRTARALSDTVEATLTNCLRFERNHTHAAAQDRDPVRGMLGGA